MVRKPDQGDKPAIPVINSPVVTLANRDDTKLLKEST